MKKKSTLFLGLLGAIGFVLLTSETTGVLDSSGKLGNAGGPGEYTCSNSGCHGSGNGNSSTGGLLDNSGSGSISLTAIPAFTGNTYIPGQMYQITVHIAEVGKSKFGFSCEFLDNTGNTNLSFNNSVGLISITNTVTTRKGQPFGTGRVCATHKTNGGASANSANFTFNWTAPTSGIVNVYYDGASVNNDALANASDNVYANNFQLMPNVTSVNENAIVKDLKILQNPVKDNILISYNTASDVNVEANIIDISGKIMIQSPSKHLNAGNQTEIINVSGLSNGLYFLVLNGEGFTKSEKIIISN